VVVVARVLLLPVVRAVKGVDLAPRQVQHLVLKAVVPLAAQRVDHAGGRQARDVADDLAAVCGRPDAAQGLVGGAAGFGVGWGREGGLGCGLRGGGDGRGRRAWMELLLPVGKVDTDT